jgi:hypothetical protein
MAIDEQDNPSHLSISDFNLLNSYDRRVIRGDEAVCCESFYVPVPVPDKLRLSLGQPWQRANQRLTGGVALWLPGTIVIDDEVISRPPGLLRLRIYC